MTPEREALLPIIHEIARSARNRLCDPANVSKGSWSHLSRPALIYMLLVEVVEFILSLYGWGDSPEHEAGDVTVCKAMLLQRVREEKYMSSYEERFLAADANLMFREKTGFTHTAETLARGLMAVEIEYLASELCRVATRKRMERARIDSDTTEEED